MGFARDNRPSSLLEPVAAVPEAPEANEPLQATAPCKPLYLSAPDLHLVATEGGWDGAIEPPPPCSQCGSLKLWRCAAGDHRGLVDGFWKCVHCDPPTEGPHIRRLVAIANIRRERLHGTK